MTSTSPIEKLIHTATVPKSESNEFRVNDCHGANFTFGLTSSTQEMTIFFVS